MCRGAVGALRRWGRAGVSKADGLTHPNPRLTLGTSTSQSIWQRADFSDAGSGEYPPLKKALKPESVRGHIEPATRELELAL